MASEVSQDRSLLCSSDGRIMLIQSSQNFVSSLTNILHVAQFALNKIDQIRTHARNSCLGSIFSTGRMTFDPSRSVKNWAMSTCRSIASWDRNFISTS